MKASLAGQTFARKTGRSGDKRTRKLWQWNVWNVILGASFHVKSHKFGVHGQVNAQILDTCFKLSHYRGTSLCRRLLQVVVSVERLAT